MGSDGVEQEREGVRSEADPDENIYSPSHTTLIWNFISLRIGVQVFGDTSLLQKSFTKWLK